MIGSMGRRRVQVAGAARLRHLSGRLMADQRWQSSGRRYEERQINARGHAHLLEHMDRILGANVSRGARREGAAANAAQSGVKPPRARFVGG